MVSSTLAEVSSNEELRGGTDDPTTRTRKAVAQRADADEAPSMELAFGGVKSTQMRSIAIFATAREIPGQLEPILFRFIFGI